MIWNRLISLRLVALWFLLFGLTPATSFASLITYDLTHLGGADYRYDYTITNDGSLPGGAALEVIDIAFDPTLYQESSLTIVSDAGLAVDWDQNIFASHLSIPAIFDIFALGSGIASGNSVNGFAVTFIWLGGPALPGSQSFEILDPNTFNVLASGVTSLQADTVVSQPSLWVLLLSGVVGLLGMVKRRHDPVGNPA